MVAVAGWAGKEVACDLEEQFVGEGEKRHRGGLNVKGRPVGLRAKEIAEVDSAGDALCTVEMMEPG